MATIPSPLLSECLHTFRITTEFIRKEAVSGSIKTATLTTVDLDANVVPFHILHHPNIIPDILTAVDQWFAAEATRNPPVDLTFQTISDFCLQLHRDSYLGPKVEAGVAFATWVRALRHYRGGKTQAVDLQIDSGHRVQCDRILKFQGESSCMLELTSTIVFDHYAPRILDLARGENNNGTALQISDSRESEERSIIFKLGVKMIHNRTRFGLLFDGLKAILLQKIYLPTQDTTHRFYLACSDVYSIVDNPFLQLLYGLSLGDDLGIQGHHNDLVPPVPARLPPTDEKPPSRVKPSTSNRYNIRPSSGKQPAFASVCLGLSTIRFPTSCRPQHAFQLKDVWTRRGSCGSCVAQLEIWSFLAVGGGGAVYEGYIVDGHGNYLRVAVKLFDETKDDCFQSESTAYRLLESCHGDVVPIIYGIYTFAKGMGLIVMEFLERASECHDAKDVTPEKRLELVTAMKKIHRCGILHGDIELRNMYVGDSRCYFYDFSHSWTAEKLTTAGEMDRETERLQSLLELESVRP